MSARTETIGVAVPPDTKKELEKFCEKRGISKSMAGRRALRQYLGKVSESHAAD